MHLAVGVHVGIAHRLAALGEEDLNGRLFPAQHGEVDGADGREEFLASGAVVHADESHNPSCLVRLCYFQVLNEDVLLVARPCAVGKFDVVVLDVDEARLGEVLPTKDGGVRVGAELGKRLEEQFGEALDGPVLGNGVVVGVDVAIDVLEFDPGARLHVAETESRIRLEQGVGEWSIWGHTRMLA